MTIEQNNDDARESESGLWSEEDYWAKIKAYNADGTYRYPPPPINADQVFDFWMHVPVPDTVLSEVQARDQARHAEMHQQLHLLHTSPRFIEVPAAFGRSKLEYRLPLSPERLQADLDAIAKRRKYRKHPELLEQTKVMAELRQAIQQTNEIRSSVPPRPIPGEQIRMAARLGRLMYNSEGLQATEYNAIWNFEVVFMGERQSIRQIYEVWRPDLIV
jgi:hypothetical protein